MGFSGTRAVAEFDLEDFERRLRTAGSLPTAAEDPLFELARLVETARPEPARGVATGVLAAPGSASLEAAELRPALEEDEFYGELGPADNASQAEDEPIVGRHDRIRPGGGAFGRKARIAALALAGVAMIGAVAVIKRGAPGLSSQPPFIAAAKGPIKVAPPSDATVSAPSESGGYLLRDSSKSTPVRVVAAEEQPIDLSALSSTGASEPSPAAQPPTDASNESAVKATVDTPLVISQPAPRPTSSSQFPDPKPVRTVSLRPDGTPISASAAASFVSNEAPAPAEPPKGSEGGAPKTATAAEAIAQPSTPKLDLPTKLSGKSSARVEVAKMDTTAPGANAEAVNEPSRRSLAAKPEKSSKTARPQVASAEAETPSPGQTADSNATKSGGWAVQLAAPRSEADAKRIMEKYSAKYASALNGSTIGVHKATVKGETIYRLRVVGLSKADAAALCARLKGDGGDCFIAK